MTIGKPIETVEIPVVNYPGQISRQRHNDENIFIWNNPFF